MSVPLLLSRLLEFANVRKRSCSTLTRSTAVTGGLVRDYRQQSALDGVRKAIGLDALQAEDRRPLSLK
jgi:hypothetical protein